MAVIDVRAGESVVASMPHRAAGRVACASVPTAAR